jgi:hypothetical protein
MNESRLFRVFGMRRAGNHAVIDWMRAGLSGETVFLNDCRPGDPWSTFEMLETPSGERHGPSFRATRWFAQFPDGRATRNHILSYEDKTPGDVGLPPDWPGPWRTVIVHRSFLNWLASYLRLVLGRQRGTRWGVSHVDEVRPAIAAYRDLLCSAGDAISFDRWVGDADYRRTRLAALGLVPRDDRPAAQAIYGGGSSFEPSTQAPQGRDLTRRWQAMAGEGDFVTLAEQAARDHTLIEALEEIYPDDARRLRRVAATGRLTEDIAWSN